METPFSCTTPNLPCPVPLLFMFSFLLQKFTSLSVQLHPYSFQALKIFLLSSKVLATPPSFALSVHLTSVPSALTQGIDKRQNRMRTAKDKFCDAPLNTFFQVEVKVLTSILWWVTQPTRSPSISYKPCPTILLKQMSCDTLIDLLRCTMFKIFF